MLQKIGSVLCLMLLFCVPARSTSEHAIKLAQVLKHSTGVTSLAFSPEGQHLICGGESGQLQQWDVATGRRKLLWKGKESRAITALAFSPDERLLGIGIGGDVAVWDMRSRRIKWMRHQKDTGQLNSLAFSPDGKLLATAHVQWRGEGESGQFKVWSAHTGRLVHRQSCGALDSVAALAFTRDGKTLITNQGDGAHLWNVRTWRRKTRLRAQGNLPDPALALSKDGRLLAMGSFNSEYSTQVLLWDLPRGRLLPKLANRNCNVGAIGAAFSPDGTLLLVAGTSQVVPVRQNQIAVWNLKTGKMLQTLAGMTLVAFSPDGKTIATGTEEPEKRAGMKPGRIVRLWRLR